MRSGYWQCSSVIDASQGWASARDTSARSTGDRIPGGAVVDHPADATLPLSRPKERGQAGDGAGVAVGGGRVIDVDQRLNILHDDLRHRIESSQDHLETTNARLDALEARVHAGQGGANTGADGRSFWALVGYCQTQRVERRKTTA